MGDLKKENKFVETEEKFIEVEKRKKERKIISTITDTDGTGTKMISASVNINNYTEFTKINKSKGMSNNSVLNMLIADYVRNENQSKNL